MKKIIHFLQKVGLLHIGTGDYITGEFNSKLDNKKLKTKTDSQQNNNLPLFFWWGLYLLFAVCLLLALIFSLQTMLSILIIWIIFILLLKKLKLKLTPAIVSLSLIFLLSIAYLIFFTRSNTHNKQSASQQSTPKLAMTIIKSPKTINCDSEVSTIEISAKNIDKKPLTFTDIQNHKYDFEICDGDRKNDSGRACYSLADDYLTVNNFGEIKPDQTKNITLTTPAKYDNAIASFLQKTKINGSYKYYVDFVQIKNPKLKPILSKSDLFTAQTNIMDPNNEYIKDDCGAQ